MSENQKPCAATPNATLEEQIVNPCVPKNEREWWARHEILKQRQRIAELEAQVEEKDEEIASLRSSCHSFDLQVTELEAEVARLKEQAKGPHSGYRIL